MAIFIKFRQNNDPQNPQSYKLWYARAYQPETVTLRHLAEKMQANCTVKRADILAVLSELADTMRDELQNGKTVYIDGIGYFKIGLSSRGLNKPDDFHADRDVRDLHIVFRPDSKWQPDGTRRIALLEGTRLLPLPK